MDRAAIEELFTLTKYSWREHERVIRPLGDGTLTEPAPGSGWPALRDRSVWHQLAGQRRGDGELTGQITTSHRRTPLVRPI